MAGVNVRFRGDSGPLTDAQREIIVQVTELNNQYRKAAKESADLERAAKRTFEQTRTPLETYNRRLTELGEQLKSRKIDQDTYNRAVAQAKQRFDDASTAQRGFVDINVTKLAGIATQYIGISQAVQAVATAMRAAREEAKQAARDAAQAEVGLGELAQLSGGSPERLAQLRQQASGLFQAGAGKTLDESARILFNAVSANLAAPQDIALIERISATQFANAEALTNAANTIRVAFGDAAGDLGDILSQGIVGSEAAPARLDQLLTASASVGTSATALGVELPEAIAAVAKLGEAAGSVDVGATRLSRFFTVAEKEGFEGSLREIVQQFDALGLSGAELVKQLGSREAVEGFRLLRQHIDTIAENAERIRAGREGRAIETALDVGAAAIAADTRRRQAEAARVTAGLEVLAPEEIERETLRAQFQAGQIRAGVGGVNRALAGVTAETVATFGAGAEATVQTESFFSRLFTAFTAPLEQTGERIQRQNEVLEETLEEARATRRAIEGNARRRPEASRQTAN